jgi:hypothetical protein
MPKKIVALDGGGARGLYICFLLFLLAQHIRVALWQHCDLVIGTSVGAVLAAAIALDMTSHPEMKEKFIEAIRVSFKTFNKEEPFLECRFNGANKEKALRHVFGKYKLRDAKCPLAIATAFWSNGRMRVFSSTDAKDGDLNMADLLNAATAAPSLFPAVQVEGRWMMDGGVRHNMPLDWAVLCAQNLWGRAEKFCILNIGTRSSQLGEDKEPDFTNPEWTGLVQCLQAGILDIMMGVYDDTCLRRVRNEYGEACVLRIEPQLPPAFDDVTQKSIDRMQAAAQTSWDQHKQEILQFFTLHERG